MSELQALNVRLADSTSSIATAERELQRVTSLSSLVFVGWLVENWMWDRGRRQERQVITISIGQRLLLTSVVLKSCYVLILSLVSFGFVRYSIIFCLCCFAMVNFVVVSLWKLACVSHVVSVHDSARGIYNLFTYFSVHKNNLSLWQITEVLQIGINLLRENGSLVNISCEREREKHKWN